MRVLFVEDEKLLAEALKHLFETNGFMADTAFDGKTGKEKALGGDYDLIVLDVMLPGGISGLDILKAIREQGKKTPVMMLTAKDSLEDKVLGLNLGADDYLVKPFEADELLARVHAIARRFERIEEEPGLSFGDLRLIKETSEMRSGESSVSLTAKEMKLLEFLIKNVGHPVAKPEILKEIWGKDSEVSENSVELYIHYLRKKLENSNVRIKTIRDRGYILQNV